MIRNYANRLATRLLSSLVIVLSGTMTVFADAGETPERLVITYHTVERILIETIDQILRVL